MKKVSLHTDGTCSGNQGPGGWAAVLVFDSYERELVGGACNTTSRQMELMAVIHGLEDLNQPCIVEIFPDSKYIVNGINNWLNDWKSRKWRRPGSMKLVHKKLWQRLDQAMSDHEVSCRWVKGHAGHDYSERCDRLAREQVEKFRDCSE